jgi:hypothetical protein
MTIKPIKTESDHAAALREIERLWGADEGTPAGDRLEVLTTLAGWRRAPLCDASASLTLSQSFTLRQPAENLPNP